MIEIKDLWKIDDLIKERYGKKYFNQVDYCGLNPIRPLERYEYFCTPINSITFATTAGDGVHFGFITDKGSEVNDGAVVMTVPMTDKNNIVVAESLEEFLSLGYHVGWYALEQLAYDEKDTIEFYSKPDPEISREAKLFLEIIRNELSIDFKAITKDRLNDLHKMYYSKLEIEEFNGFNYDLLKPELRKKVKDFLEGGENDKS